jgi:predicted AlkP superfamily pyrophosphatase or phosphodiesterase
MRRLFLFLLSLVPLAAQPVRGGGPLENDPSHRDKPYVLLISLDGFRFDYAERHKAANILKLRDSGSHAGSLLPVYPTTTFPNHLSLVTGMYPAHHGIVENNFYDPVRKAPYVFRNPARACSGRRATPKSTARALATTTSTVPRFRTRTGSSRCLNGSGCRPDSVRI